MCSWAVTAVVDHFLFNKVAVFSAAMDMSKAFNLVEWCKLYGKLLDPGIAIYITIPFNI